MASTTQKKSTASTAKKSTSSTKSGASRSKKTPSQPQKRPIRREVWGVILLVLGILSVCLGFGSDRVLLLGGGMVAVMGAWLLGYYLGFGIFYDQESFLVCAFGKKSRLYRYEDIQGQSLYVVTGGNTVIELQLSDGTALTLSAAMEGTFPFLDMAFAGWCRQTGTNPESCSFHDPSRSWWFPHPEVE